MSDAYEADLTSEYPEEYDESKWHGVPPAGEKPAPSRMRYLIEITLVLIVEIGLWAVYRALTADFYGQFGTLWFYVGHIIAAPTIHLGPILIYWIFIRKERLFVRSDKENGQHRSFSLGPFKMTRKFLFTAVLIGLFGGIVWRFSEMVVYDITGVALGGGKFGTFWIYDIFTGSNFWLFLLMTFVMFFIVGPVEEFEFRSFVHDQSQRVLPKWGALIYSSIFFGFSHIPIALTVYKMTFVELIFAEISWMTAGAVFGALYMWSRNIFACIVMHGIGNWQLSVYFWQSKILGNGLSSGQEMFASLMTSIVANALLIVIFFLVHKFYWEPQRRGEAAFGGKLLRLQTHFFKHDNATMSIFRTSGALSLTTVLTLIVIVAGTVLAGSSIQDIFADTKEVTPDGFDITEYSQFSETMSDTVYLDEDGLYSFEFNSSSDKIVSSITASINWEDETTKPGRPTVRNYQNQPDTFLLELIGPDENMSDSAEGENQAGGQGNLNVNVNIPQEQILSTEGSFIVNLQVTMVDAGMWSAPFSLIGFTDSGNEFDIVVEIQYMEIPGSEPVVVEEEVPEEESME